MYGLGPPRVSVQLRHRGCRHLYYYDFDTLVLCSNRTHRCSCASRWGSRRPSLRAPSLRDSNPGRRTRLAVLRSGTLVAGAGAARVSGTRHVCWNHQVSVSWRIPIFYLSKCWPLLVRWVGQFCCYVCMCVSRFFGWWESGGWVMLFLNSDGKSWSWVSPTN